MVVDRYLPTALPPESPGQFRSFSMTAVHTRSGAMQQHVMRIVSIAVCLGATVALSIVTPTPNAAARYGHEVQTHIEWTGPQNFIEFNWPLLTDHKQVVRGKVSGNNQVNLVQQAVPGDYFGADPIIGDNSYISCTVTVDGREALRDAAYRGDGHDCNCLRIMS